MIRNQFTEDQAINRMKSQMPLAEKVKKADIIVDNSGNFDDLQKEFINVTIPSIVD
jgi:dephospho-CoA kinase